MELIVVTYHRVNSATEVWMKDSGEKVWLRVGEIITFKGSAILYRGEEILGNPEMLRERSSPLYKFGQLVAHSSN